MKFVHLHVHSQYSILDGASNIKQLIKKAAELNMPAIAITDHGNLFGIKEFLNETKKHNESEKQKAEKYSQQGTEYIPKLIKPIVGCEMYVARRSRFDKEKNTDDKSGNHLIVLAKNKTGYYNLIKLVSLSYIEGFYSKPRIDKELLYKYKEGLIISTACLAGEIPQYLLTDDYDAALKAAKEFKNEFGEDFYLEMQYHPTKDETADQTVYIEQEKVNKGLVKISKETGIKLICTNDVHFINKEDAEAHDRLICINTNTQVSDQNRLRYTKQEWLKSYDEMFELFHHYPEAIQNTLEIAEKIEEYSIDHPPVMPEFSIPENFATIEQYRQQFSEKNLIEEFGEENFKRLGGYEKVLRIKLEADYLNHLVQLGKKERYGNKADEKVENRINFELETIKRMGYPGYFLIVSDVIQQARSMGIRVGPGRGSAAGSVISYCLKITDLDPIKYNLLFERFLNPERISMPDIDIDFDEDGRTKILQWVVEKYGKDKVASIITFGRMAAKSAIRDVARVQNLPLNEATRLTKLIPEELDITLEKAFTLSEELRKEKESGDPIVKETLTYATILEGSVRQTGIHACGIIISKDNLIEHIPVCTSKETNLLVTQYDGHYLEEVGMLKMDFLGLKTLSIIQDTLEIIEQRHGKKIDIDQISLNDKKTYELFSKGLTTGIFQFESEGMKKFLKELKPDRFEDLIAMNALFRPGPMKYIPQFIARKHGLEPIQYDLPEMKEYLEETYGITVYQEQVMLLSQKLAGFTKGEADALRKAMGKKQRDVLDKMKNRFIEGCKANNLDIQICEKIWTDWEAFAQYAFNKSHSTCYAYLAYQTAYLKAHYTAEFLAANLSRNLDDIKELGKLMNECRRMNIGVKGPSINESNIKFTVNSEGAIRFGLGGIKGLGESAAQAIIEERKKNGLFSSIYNFAERMDSNIINKKSYESLAYSGAFDDFTEIQRHQYFCDTAPSFLEQIVKYSQQYKTDRLQNQQTLFGDSIPVSITKPLIPKCQEWSNIYQLKKEAEYIGMYLSSHPLDPYKFDIDLLCNVNLSKLQDLNEYVNKEITFVGHVSSVTQKISKTGNPFLTAVLEDFNDSYSFNLIGQDYINYANYFKESVNLLIKAKVVQQNNPNSNYKHNIAIQKIYLLNDVRNLYKSITIDIPVNELNQQFIHEIVTNIRKVSKAGKTNLLFTFYYSNGKNSSLKWNMISKKYKVFLSNDFLSYLSENNIIFKVEKI
ncbi:MAG: DNA polymerase III subunit alpha [Bacteroidales bacterium]|nr:DNA polymerase III subunit alpha [Bacteroidales bacterium]